VVAVVVEGISGVGAAGAARRTDKAVALARRRLTAPGAAHLARAVGVVVAGRHAAAVKAAAAVVDEVAYEGAIAGGQASATALVWELGRRDATAGRGVGVTAEEALVLVAVVVAAAALAFTFTLAFALTLAFAFTLAFALTAIVMMMHAGAHRRAVALRATRMWRCMRDPE